MSRTTDQFLLRAQDGTVYPVAETTLIGREADCQIVLDNARVSRHHARITVRDGRLLVEDLRSGNGTFINGRRLETPQVLMPGDELRLHDFSLRLIATAAAEATLILAAGREAAPAAATGRAPAAGTESTYLLKTEQLARLNAMTRKEIERMPAGAGGGPGLVVLSAPIRGKVFSLRTDSVIGSWSIGRDFDADIQLVDRAISRLHARVHKHGSRWRIENLNATNPLFVNGAALAHSALADGDRILIGHIELQFKIDCSAPLAETDTPQRPTRGLFIGAMAMLGLSAALALLALVIYFQ